MYPSKQIIALSLLLNLGLGTLPMAHAGTPDTHYSPMISSNARFTDALKRFYALDKDGQKAIFEVKNAKGESIFHQKQDLMQKNLWSTLDPVADDAEGTSTERVFKDFKIPADKNEVVVAVIDSGVDIQHEDLKGHIWINLPEFYGKPGVDDDNDGFVDDIYGWNFLGSKDGKNVGPTTLEATRIYAGLKAKQDAGTVLDAEQTALFQQTGTLVNQGIQEATQNLPFYQSIVDAIELLKKNGLKDETVAAVAALPGSTPEILQAKKLATLVYSKGFAEDDMKEAVASFQADLAYHYSLTFNSSDIVKDDPNTLDEKGYGNGDVTGPDASHGTHVSGIIGAVRNNFGINGQALNVKIMAVRAVPDGDERDKDVGNAIRFAVDHGARVINMSFGKPYSPNKEFVDTAMRYAESHGVLLMHAAGNDGKNTESQANNFPNRTVQVTAKETRQIETWIEVGASSKTKGEDLPASFSNYGKTSVDVFAPGKDIVSTIPGNKYASFNGTSMATPEVSGVAALILELYPFASALEVKTAILSTTNQYPGLQCTLPGDSTKKILFSDLSATGGTVNAYQAMEWMGQK